jgi:hypothetical protein
LTTVPTISSYIATTNTNTTDPDINTNTNESDKNSSIIGAGGEAKSPRATAISPRAARQSDWVKMMGSHDDNDLDISKPSSGLDGGDYCYYFNRRTKEMSLIPWVQVKDPTTQSRFYYNVETKVRSWRPPRSSVGDFALRRALSEEGKRALLKAL